MKFQHTIIPIYIDQWDSETSYKTYVNLSPCVVIKFSSRLNIISGSVHG